MRETGSARGWAQLSAENEGLSELTGEIIRCAFAVSNELGAGFLEKVYENALAHELRRAGLAVEQQRATNVIYRGHVVGEYMADLIVNGRVIVELKAVKAFDDVHYAQCLNYLKATGMKICLLINFGLPKIGIKRFIN